MVAKVPDTLREGGAGFPLAEQSHIQGGAWAVTHINNWAVQIEPRYRAAGMRILDLHDRREYVLNATLDGVTQSAADDRIDVIATVTLADNGDGTFDLTAPESALVTEVNATWRGISLPAFTFTA